MKDRLLCMFFYVCAKCCDPKKIKTLLTYLPFVIKIFVCLFFSGGFTQVLLYKYGFIFWMKIVWILIDWVWFDFRHALFISTFFKFSFK